MRQKTVVGTLFEDRIHERQHARFVFVVLIQPTRVRLSLSQGFDHEISDALPKLLSGGLPQRPSAEQRLIQKIFFVSVRSGRSFVLAEFGRIPAAPAIYITG